jgi:hypothetical protein
MTDPAAGTPLPPPLPPGTRLLHIGPPKTGTTSLQAAFFAARAAALEQGVRYAGRTRHSSRAVLAVTGRKSIDEDGATPPIEAWDRLLREIRTAAESRVVLSSEAFAYARDPAIARVVADLDPARTHVVATLRPVARLLSSEWQEHTQSGLRVPFEDWLDALFNHPDQPLGRAFWHRQRHDRLVERWARQVGVDRCTVIVVDERDHDRLYRVFEALTGLRPGTIVPDRSVANRSLTLEEIVAMQALAERFDAEQLSAAAFHRVARMQIATYLKQRRPGPDEHRIETPQWALDRAGEVAVEIVAGLRQLGVRVVGDLDALAEVGRSGLVGDRLPDVPVGAEVAAWMTMGAVLAGDLARDRRATSADDAALAGIPTGQLARVVVRRVRRGVRRRLPGGSGSGTSAG